MRVQAQAVDRMPEYEQELYGASAHVTADYETTRNIRRYWEQEMLRLKNTGRSGYEFALVGSNENVLRVTIPSDFIFVAGDSTLSPTSDVYLFPLVRLLRGEGAVASVIVSCYSDNNGSERYLTRMTAGRAATIARWMQKQGVDPTQVHSYGLAQHSSRTDNSTMRKREQNRRVSLYLVPNKHLLKLAKKGKVQ
jgi:outer membrane protein OmpA-like peptidoglycan-associated protein